jgi:hypothetical protein
VIVAWVVMGWLALPIGVGSAPAGAVVGPCPPPGLHCYSQAEETSPGAITAVGQQRDDVAYTLNATLWGGLSVSMDWATIGLV